MAIETRGLTRRFGTHLAVDGVQLSAPSAGVYGFLGPNGAGKTTTIRMLLGLIRPDAGDVFIFGESLSAHRYTLLRRIGALVETPSLYSHLTGRENLEFTRRLLGVPRALIDRVLGIVKLAASADRRVREYSLGMRQRLGLALALLNEPQLLILDEPANGLDPAGIHEMRALIRRLPEELGITVFLSSHLLSEIEQVADHIGIINAGRLVFQGTLGELPLQRQPMLTVGVRNAAQAQQELVAAGWSAQPIAADRLQINASTESDAIAINRLLMQRQCEVFHLAVAQASLEDIF
ncbi:MAG: ABC transporter ATP-binding protein, partial [Blastocatellia bacterium]